MKTIIKYLLAFALSIGITYLGYYCGQELFAIPKDEAMSLKWFMLFLGVYIIIIRPVCDYWTDIISDFLDIPKQDQ